MLKANKTLKNNNMYSEKDIGELTSGRIIGPRELIKFHQQRKEVPNRQIYEYQRTKTERFTMVAASAFSFNYNSMIPLSMTDHKKDVLSHLAGKVLPNGFVPELL